MIETSYCNDINIILLTSLENENRYGNNKID